MYIIFAKQVLSFFAQILNELIVKQIIYTLAANVFFKLDPSARGARIRSSLMFPFPTQNSF